MRKLRIASEDLGGACVPPCGPGDDDGFQVLSFCSPPRPSPSATEASPAVAVEATGPTPAELQEQELARLLTALSLTLDELSRLREKVLHENTRDMLRLVLALAEQVIQCEVRSNPEIIVATLQRALQSAISSDEYHVKVNPQDLAVVTEKKPLFLASVSGLKNITLEGDDCVSRGGCLIESDLGRVDATIEGQLQELRQKLLPEETAPGGDNGSAAATDP